MADERPGNRSEQQIAQIRDKRGLFLPGNPGGGRPLGWRTALAHMIGANGERIFAPMIMIAEGKPLVTKLSDGRELRIIPTAGDALRAQVELAHLYVGRPVPQTDIVKVEEAAADMAEIRALDDETLRARALAILNRGSLGPGVETDAEVVVVERDWAEEIWVAREHDGKA